MPETIRPRGEIQVTLNAANTSARRQQPRATVPTSPSNSPGNTDPLTIPRSCNPGDYNDEKKTLSHITQGLDRTEQPLAGYRQTRAATTRDVYKTRPRL